MKITVTPMEYLDGAGWFVQVLIESETGTRQASHVVDAPADADIDALQAAVSALYA